MSISIFGANRSDSLDATMVARFGTQNVKSNVMTRIKKLRINAAIGAALRILRQSTSNKDNHVYYIALLGYVIC